jgi:transcriptional regulator with XRE-family HTH domain
MIDIKLKGAGEAIRALRERREVSLRDLAKTLKWDRGRLSKYENNQLPLTLHIIERIATILDERPEVLLHSCLKILHPHMGKNPVGKLLRRLIVE